MVSTDRTSTCATNRRRYTPRWPSRGLDLDTVKATDPKSAPKIPRPRCRRDSKVASRSRCSLKSSNDFRNIHDGRLIIPQMPEGEHRSEEHTSELQSLMRISYAVFCLTNKKK